MAALRQRYGPKRAEKELEKLKEKTRRNEARIKSCKLHDFDWKKSLQRDKERRSRWGVEVAMSPAVVVACGYCRCRNCGGKMPITYAAPYMDAVEQMEKIENPGRYFLKMDANHYFMRAREYMDKKMGGDEGRV